MANRDMPEGQPLASVVIPAYNAAPTLGDCLSAVLGQTVPASRYEVIVVDDGSSDATGEVARQFDVRVIRQSNQGPASARNAGASAARGEIILFTDADCSPTRDWLEQMLAPFQSPEVVGAKGTYMTRQREVVARLVQLEYEEKYQRMAQERYIDFVDTYSAAYRRDIFLASGGFDPSFTVPSAEDQELSFRIASRGYKMIFAPRAVVYHLHPSTWSGYFRRKLRFGYWRVLVHLKHPQKVLRDSHTLQVQKVQMALAGLLLPASVLALVSSAALPIALSLVVAFFVSSLAFVRQAARHGPVLGLAALPFIFLRATGLLLGALAGAVTIPFQLATRAARASVEHIKGR